MGPRRVTVSCPGCGSEHEQVTVDEAETILFDGCEECQELSS